MTLDSLAHKGVVRTVDHFAKNYAASLNERERKDTDFHCEEFIRTLPLPPNDVQAVRDFYRHLKLDYMGKSKRAGIQQGV